MVVCTIGDAVLDVIVRLDEAPARDTDAYGRTSVAAGGQAANVAAWVSSLGGRGRFIGKRANDPAGRAVEQELTARGVELAGPVAERGTGTVVSIAMPDGTRSMLSDRGIAVELAASELDRDWLDGCDVLHVPGYSLVRSPLAEAAEAAARLVGFVSVDVSSTAAVAQAGVAIFRRRVAAIAPATVFATEDEAELAGPFEAETLVIKRGAAGCVVRRGDTVGHHEALPADLVDATGAGDAFAAGFLLGGAPLALEAAARCVAQMGAMP